MIKVENSKYIHLVDYIESSSTLIVEFHRGNPKKWKYSPVTLEAYKQMMSAESIGSYFSKNIRDNPDIVHIALNPQIEN